MQERREGEREDEKKHGVVVSGKKGGCVWGSCAVFKLWRMRRLRGWGMSKCSSLQMVSQSSCNRVGR